MSGPVIHDISKNIEESWRIMEEVFPDYLVTEGRKAEDAGMFKEEDNPSGKSIPPDRVFDYKRLKDILEKMPMVVAAFQLARGSNALQTLAVCASLTLFMDMIGGLATKAFALSGNGIRPVGPWGGSYGPPEYYIRNTTKRQENEPGLPVQFTRTFCQEKADEEFSIVRAMYRAVTKVQENGLIYIENQYFRDLHFIELLKHICQGFPPDRLNDQQPRKGNVTPYLIVVTSAFSLSDEGLLAEGPSHIAYKMLEKSGIRFHFCRLHTKEHMPKMDSLKQIPAPYEDPRPMVGRSDLIMDCLWDVFKGLLTISPLVLLLLRSKFRTLRNGLWAALPLLLAGTENAPNIPALLASFDHLIRRLLTLDLSKNPIEELEPELKGVNPEDPNTPDPQADSVWATIRERLPKTAEGVAVPKMTEKGGKPNDPGNIYVHSKVLIVDQAFAMVGSANHNERSMWHDTEDMLGVRGYDSTHFPMKLRGELLDNVLSGKNIDSDKGRMIFTNFGNQLEKNSEKYSLKQDQESFILPFIPVARFGSFSVT